ncbi:MAG: M16 family metallopeptidase, partial [Woeseiaceae bacterium]
RLERAFAERMGRVSADAPARPSLIVIAGDVDPERSVALLGETYGDLPPARPAKTGAGASPREDARIRIGHRIAQAQLGYLLPAPPPGEPASYAYRLLLYILSHDYEGRFGKEAISRRGLAYYADSRYRSDGVDAWITVAVGVDPARLETLRSLFAAELERLHGEPPTATEIAEAKSHLIGRARSRAQSNEELSAELARQWTWYGRLQSPAELEQQLSQVTGEELRAIAREFSAGAFILVTE